VKEILEHDMANRMKENRIYRAVLVSVSSAGQWNALTRIAREMNLIGVRFMLWEVHGEI